MMEGRILDLLTEALPGIDFQSSDHLVEDGILDSLSLVEIISELSMEFGITIPYEEINESNFNSLAAMAAMVEKLGK